MVQTLNFGIIGTGGIAADFAQALQSSSRCKVVNVVGTSAAKARAFQQLFQLPSSAESLEQMLDDPRVEAVYVASPHPSHAEQAIQCLRAKKAVLCEKPLTLDVASAQRVIDIARAENTFLMEAFMYRCHPLMRELTARLRSGVIGRITHVRADFCFRVPRNPEGRLFNPRLGGGSILDVGGYPVSFARYIAGLIEGAPFAEPSQISAWGRLGPTGTDELASALLTFPSGFTAEVSSAVSYELGRTAVVFGESGRVILPDPWIPSSDRQSLYTELTVHRDGQAPETVAIRTEKPTYAIEAELVADTLPAIEARSPAMSWADTLGNLRVLDAWRAALGRTSASSFAASP
jgi:predicted dehydrogenase